MGREARCFGFGKEIAIKHIRPVMPLLMMRASLEAQQRFAPENARISSPAAPGCSATFRLERRQPHQLGHPAL